MGMGVVKFLIYLRGGWSGQPGNPSGYTLGGGGGGGGIFPVYGI